MKSRFWIASVATIVLCVASNSVLAIAPFKKAFDAKYVKASENTEFQTKFKKTGCYACHVKGKKKNVVNAYGWELAKLLDGNAKDRIDAARKAGSDAKKAEEAKLVKELLVALPKVEAMEATSGKTYGELFKSHALPSTDGAKSVRE